MTNVEALKKLAAAIMNNELAEGDIPGKTTADIIEFIAKVKAGEYLMPLTVSSAEGSTEGTTKISVSPAIGDGNSYAYATSSNPIPEPEYLEDGGDYTAWNGTSDIEAEDGHRVAIYELNAEGQIVKFGQTVATVNLG